MPPDTQLVSMLTDNGQIGETGGLFDQIVAMAASDVEGFLCARYAVPFTAPYPPAVIAASRAFTLWYLANRRVEDDKNPYRGNRTMWRERLADIGDGKIALDFGHPRFVGSAKLPPRCVQPPHWLNIADNMGAEAVGTGVDLTLLNQGR